MNNIFKNLFVLEMANNHQGSKEHGLKIIQAAAEIVKKHDVNAGLKFQYRHLDTFIHPAFKEKQDIPHIPRFISTKLEDSAFLEMIDAVKNNGMRSIVTPFDEASVEKCVNHDVDILKIASCSATDWPLLEAVAATGKPVIASTGGLDIKEIDSLVSYFEHRGIDFALMHCVSIYPTPNELGQMHFVTALKKRYPGLFIGYSGHEAPDNNDFVKVAVGRDVDMLERHIGVPAKDIKLNAYSMNPEQLDKWLESYKVAKSIIGTYHSDKILVEAEQESLLSLKRGVFAKRAIKKGVVIRKEDVYFAMPCENGQTTSGEFGQYRTEIVATRNYSPNEGIYESNNKDLMHRTRSILHQCKGMINEAGVKLGDNYEVEISHHFGLEKFPETGCTIVNLINREYCKKLIIVLAGQENPMHMHKLKEETFQLLWGDLTVNLEGNILALKAGDTLLVERGKWHSFKSNTGAIFEEISTTHRRGDSYYKDPAISKMDPMQRKTIVDLW